MTKDQFRKLQKTLRVYLNQAEKEAIDKGVDITSPEYDEAVLELKTVVLKRFGMTVEEYESLKEDFRSVGPKVVANLVSIDDILSEEKVKELAVSVFNEDRVRELAKSVIPKQIPPQIINKTEVVKEITKPQVIERTVERVVVDNARLDDLIGDILALQSANSELYKKLDTPINLPLEFREKWAFLTGGGTADSLHTHDIRQRRGFGGVDKDTVQHMIDRFIIGDGVIKITVGTVEPTSPAVGDLWVDTT